MLPARLWGKPVPSLVQHRAFVPCSSPAFTASPCAAQSISRALTSLLLELTRGFVSWGPLKPAHKAIEVDANSSAQQESGTCGSVVVGFSLENLSLLSPSTPAGYGQRYPNHAAMSASRRCPSQKGSPPRSAVPGQGAGGAGGSGAAHSPSTSVTAHGVGGLLLPPPCLKLDAAEEADCKINYAFSKT